MKKNNVNVFRIIFLIAILIFLLVIVPMSYSRFESNATSNVDSSVAYYVLNAGYQYVDVKIPELIPSNDPYIYNFSISNNKNSKRLETLMQYDLKIKTTTNLQLDYELYMNENYLNPTATDIILATNVIQDEHDTYFKEMTTATNYFTYLYNEVNNYTLLIYFPKQYSDYKYQDIIESIFIIIESKQVLQ